MKQAKFGVILSIFLALLIFGGSILFTKVFFKAASSVGEEAGISKVCTKTGLGIDHYKEQIVKFRNKLDADKSLKGLDPKEIEKICSELQDCFILEYQKSENICK